MTTGTRMDIGIIGGSGYGGAELLRLLASHPTLKVRTVGAGRAAGTTVADQFPHLCGLPVADEVLVPAEPEWFAGHDLVFLATPHGPSLDLAPALLTQDVKVVDLSAAFRLAAETFAEWYGEDHAAPELTPAPYGLPELFRGVLADAALVAGPGCYPTATLLALAPLAGIVDPARVVVNAMSGSSGAGKALRDDLHASHASGNVAAYGAPRHRHTPEIAGQWRALAGEDAAVSFIPHLVPMARGLLATVVADLTGDVDAESLHERFVDTYRDEPFVTMLPAGSWPATTHVVGGNGAHIGVAFDGVTGRAIVACAIDNLVKGAAGQALQAANLMLGLPETEGLSPAGVYP